jgi:hypothetical protein
VLERLELDALGEGFPAPPVVGLEGLELFGAEIAGVNHWPSIPSRNSSTRGQREAARVSS